MNGSLPGLAPEAAPPQAALLDFFFPGFSVFSTAAQKYLHIDLSLYIPLVLLCGGLTWAWQYCSDYAWSVAETHLMSVVDIRTDDEVYNYLMTWVAAQPFAQGSRRFVVNTNLNSRSWFVRWWDDDEESDDEGEEAGSSGSKKNKKALSYTPTFGTHWFWYKGRMLMFKRSQNREQATFMVASEREEISVSCFGRNPWVLKELLHEARQTYMKRDESKTLIYRGKIRGDSTEPQWQRCMARTPRPFSTVILNEKVKKDLIDDVTDYLNPATRRWYSNRGIPYRRGYLLYGPPGTGKSSLSLALAGFFKMRIYIVSLSSMVASEENLGSLFTELPRRCVVLLEDIDTAGLTHTREDDKGEGARIESSAVNRNGKKDRMTPGQLTPGDGPVNGRLSLSGLLNILDGVASQEGRVLIMTTNHLEKLDKALIRPGRVDMIVKFDRADQDMTAAIFRAIFAPLEADDVVSTSDDKALLNSPEAQKQKAAEEARKKEEITARVSELSEEFANSIPAHEFSPAEIQGYLLKNKRDPEAAVKGAEQWVIDARKEKKEKELKEAEEARKAEEAKKEEEKKKKEEEEKEKKEAEEKKKEEEKKEKKEAKRKAKKSRRKSRKSKHDDSSDSSSSDDSSSESEAENTAAKKHKSADKKADTEECKVVVTVSSVDSATTPHLKIQAASEDGKHGKHGSDSGYATPATP